MILYYSGDGSHWSQPEIALRNECTLMLTFWPMYQSGKLTKRFKMIKDKRKENYLKKKGNVRGKGKS